MSTNRNGTDIDPTGMDLGPDSAAARGPGAPVVGDRPLGISLLTWLYWFWGGAIALLVLGLAFGEGPVPIAGETVPREEALGRVLPILVPMGLAVVGAALALSLRRAWARPAVLLPVALAAFGPALGGVQTTLADLAVGASVVLVILAGLVWYLYFRTRVTAYFDRLEDGDDGGAG